uniref:Uncharacterized protein n=1 Tax=Quercus lobata TaxID=97700 RepID=A0A7N2LW61_QUELO
MLVGLFIPISNLILYTITGAAITIKFNILPQYSLQKLFQDLSLGDRQLFFEISIVGLTQSLSPDDIGHLSLPSDSGLPIDITNGSELVLDLTQQLVMERQSPLVPRDIGWHLSLPSDSGLPFPMDVTNGSGLGFRFDSTICDGFDLGSLSMAYPSVNNDSNFNQNPQSKHRRTS